MSYRCQNCHEVFGSGERPERTVTQTREKLYNAAQVDRMGWEIVEEKMCCTPCSIRLDARISKVYADPKLGSVVNLPSAGALAKDAYYETKSYPV